MRPRLLTFFLSLATAAVPARAATWYVDTANGNDGNPGTQARPFETIAHGLSVAQSGDTVQAADGTYTGADNRNLDFAGKAITLRSQNGAQKCIIDCQKHDRAFTFHTGETAAAVVDGFTVQNGAPAGQLDWLGGAVRIENSSPTLRNCIFSGNSVPFPGGQGGAVYMAISASSVQNCTFTGNTAEGGGILESGEGGALYATGGTVSLTDCAINSNLSHNGYGDCRGGALELNGCASTLLRCRFTSNQCVQFNKPTGDPQCRGGAVSIESGSAGLTQCVFTGNTASSQYYAFGGGLYASGATLAVPGCAFTGNTATSAGNNNDRGEGGRADLIGGAQADINGCTFTGNTADGGNGTRGGGLNCNSGCTVRVTHAVFLNNTVHTGKLNYGTQPALGGGAATSNGSLSLTDCLVAANTTQSPDESLGGGVHGTGSQLTLLHCTVTRNACSGPSGPSTIRQGGGCLADAATLTVENSIIYGNTAIVDPNVAGGAAITYTDVEGGYAGTGDINADPLFVNAAGNDFHLQSGSPARDAANANVTGLPFTDLEGLPRIMGPAPDMGVYEFVALTALFVDIGSGSDSNPGTPALPFKSVARALAAATDAATRYTIAVRAGNYPTDRPRITKKARIQNWGGGVARIGAQG